MEAMDKNGVNKAAFDRMNAERETPIKVRLVKYLNSIVEQDHRSVQRVTRPMLGFKSFRAAQAVLAGIELMQMIRKGQFNMAGCDSMSIAKQFYTLVAQGRPKQEPACPSRPCSAFNSLTRLNRLACVVAKMLPIHLQYS